MNLSKVIEEVTRSCFTCAALAKIPKSLTVQSSSDPPETVGSQFACDVLRRERQMILVIREYVSSFTYTQLLKSEKNEDLRDGIIRLIVGVIPLDGPNAVVRVDPAPGFKPLVGDRVLNQHRINIDMGRVKNVNKNPVAEKAVQELEEAIIRIERHNETLDSKVLALVTARLNNRIRGNGLSAREVLLQRDQFSHKQIPIQDREIIFDKHAKAIKAHQYSELQKSNGKPIRQPPTIRIGDLVHLTTDKSKHHPRDRYIVTSTDGHWCQIRKFVGSQLRTNPYKVPFDQIYRVPSQPDPVKENFTSEDDEDTCPIPAHISAPEAPMEIPIPDEIMQVPTEEETSCVMEQLPVETHVVVDDTMEHISNDVEDALKVDMFVPQRSTRIRGRPKYLEDYKQ